MLYCYILCTENYEQKFTAEVDCNDDHASLFGSVNTFKLIFYNRAVS